jgi:hypothetical protein
VFGAACALVAAFGLLACGGAGAGDEYVGFWRAADVAIADFTLLEVSKDGDAYRVRLDYESPHLATLNDDVLLVQGGAAAEPEEAPDAAADGRPALELTLRQGRVVLLRVDVSSSPVEVALQRVDEAAYRDELAAMCDDRVRIEIMGLAAAVRSWAEGHGGLPPAVPEFAADSAFGRSLATLGEAWPANPFTAAPMHPGADPGDFAYTTDGHGFELVGHLSGGEDYSAE